MTYRCPECGDEVSFQGYRMLFVSCDECGETFHIDGCISGDGSSWGNREFAGYLENETDFGDFEIMEELEGDHNRGVVFRSDGEKFVIRKSKEVRSKEKALENEMKILEFLEHKDLDFVPRSVLYDEQQHLHITTFVGEKDVALEELEDGSIELFVENLTEVHELSYEDYVDFCKSRGWRVEEIQSPEDRIELIRKKLSNAEGLNEKELLLWCREKLGQLENDPHQEPLQPGLTHNDLPGSLRDGEDIYFIDWEFSSFTHNPVSDLADLLVDEDVSEERGKEIKRRYKEKQDLEDEIDSSVRLGKSLRLLLGLAWALERASELRDRNEDGEKYREYARNRKEKFEAING